MKVIEEQKALKLQIISLIFLFLSTVMIQVADHRIAEHNKAILNKTLDAVNVLQIHTAHLMSSEFNTIRQFLPFDDVAMNKKSMISRFKTQEYKDKEVVDLYSKLENDSISMREFHTELVRFHDQKKFKSLNEYNTKAANLKNYVKVGTPWTFWRKVILILHVVFIGLLLYGYSNLLISISHRIKEQKSKRG